MQWLLVFFYSALFCFCISKMKFFKSSGIKIQWWCLIFLFKVEVGIFYAYIHSLSYNGADTIFGFNQGVRIYHLIQSQGFSTYFKLVCLPCHYPSYSGIERWTHNSIPYGDESYYLIIRFHALSALISGCYYNVHVVFFNILSFAGCAFIYAAFKDELKEKRNLLIVALILIPSVVFWTSGIHKDGLSLLAIGMLFYSLKERNKISIQRIIIGTLGIMLLYIVRSYALVILIPLLSVYFIFKGKEKRLWLYYSITFFGFLLFVFLISSVIGGTSPLDKVLWWKNTFRTLSTSENSVALPDANADIFSFLQLIPYALLHSFLQPFLWDTKNIYQLIVGIQDWALLVLIVCLIINSLIKKKPFTHLFYLSIGYTTSIYLLLGMIVPNLGALSRYKSTGTLFLCISIISLLPKAFMKRSSKH